MIKSELRRIYLEKRRSLDSKEIALLSRQIAGLFFESFDLSTVKNLHCFLPIAKLAEIDTNFILEKVWADLPQVQTVAPRVDRATGELHHYPFGPETRFLENEWGIREPVPTADVDPTEIDMVLVPLVCFDNFGHRLGYGKGFYDRFLAGCRADCLKVGLSHFLPVGRISDINPLDVALNFCITPESLVGFKSNPDSP